MVTDISIYFNSNTFMYAVARDMDTNATDDPQSE